MNYAVAFSVNENRIFNAKVYHHDSNNVSDMDAQKLQKMLLEYFSPNSERPRLIEASNQLNMVLSVSGSCVFGQYRASGKNKASFAARRALSHPLLPDMISADHVLLLIKGSEELKTSDFEALGHVASTLIDNYVRGESNSIIFCGLEFDNTLNEDVIVYALATGVVFAAITE
ncbi:MAG: hypothetical protein KAZ85_01305 [Gammaproteobacteria bacterium]|nr:hypothetical protein [Gammaproteobacteria bacterium]